MFKNLLILSLRNIRKHKAYALINILGLSLGIACSVLIFGYVQHELNYDTYHDDHERVFRIESYRDSYVGEFYNNSVGGPVGPSLTESSPLIEKQARLIPPFENSKNVLVEQENLRFFETDIYFADPEIKDILKFEFLAGNKETALDEPFSLIITESIAEKYFGNQDCIGKTLNIEIDYDYYCPVARDDFTITAVIKDTPSNTHVPITMLLSMNSLRTHLPWIDEYWGDAHRKYTYVKIVPNADIRDLEPHLKELATTNHEVYKQITGREWISNYYYLQPIKNIHMDQKIKYKIIPGGNWYYIKIYSLIAFVVLLIGCLNFINISAALGMKSIKQMGIRKVVGANRLQLVSKCFLHASIYAVLSFIIALIFIEILLPIFNQLTNMGLTISTLINSTVIFATIGLLLLIVLLSGSYNAIVLTKNKSFNVLKGKLSPKGCGSVIQKILVVTQFTVIISFLTFSIYIYKQLDYMRGSSLGFDMEQKIVIPFKTHLGRLRTDYENIKSAFTKYPEITGATVSSGVPGNMSGGYYIKRVDIPDAESNFFQVLTTDTDFIKEFELTFLAGNDFEPDALNGYIINETGLKLLGFTNPT